MKKLTYYTNLIFLLFAGQAFAKTTSSNDPASVSPGLFESFKQTTREVKKNESEFNAKKIRAEAKAGYIATLTKLDSVQDRHDNNDCHITSSEFKTLKSDLNEEERFVRALYQAKQECESNNKKCPSTSEALAKAEKNVSLTKARLKTTNKVLKACGVNYHE